MHSADRLHPAMESLRCCFYNCPDITDSYRVVYIEPNMWLPGRAVYPHMCVWDCTEYREKAKKKRKRGALGTICKVEEAEEEHSRDPFYGHFKRLPYEMQRHCLSFLPTFHMLVNPAFWIEQDRLHFERIMTSDKHMTPHADSRDSDVLCACYKSDSYYLNMYDLNRTHLSVYVGTDDGLHMNLFPRNKRIDRRYGDMNRYVSCYYRKCAHFDEKKSLSDNKDKRFSRKRKRSGKKKKNRPNKEATDRWVRLNRCLGTRRTLDSQRIEDFNRPDRMFRKLDSYSSHNDSESLRQPVKVALEPGVYYWEFINYNWEEVVSAAAAGRQNRQEHFFLNPSDAATHRFQKKRMRMSLMYRRVVHPSEEIDNRYTTLGYFETSVKDFKKIVYLVFDRDRFPANWTMTWRKMMYQHVLTPAFGVEVYEHRCVCCYEVIYYSAVFPDNVQLYSLDLNRTTVRWNFFVEVDDMNHDERTRFGAPLLHAVRSGVDKGYAFVPGEIQEDWAPDTEDVFKFFFL